jgi:hypothetical protein
MSPAPITTTEPDEPTIYRIRVKGHLAPRWAQWFEPLAIIPEPDGDTLLTGPVVDQAALHGVLKRIRDLGLPLLSIERIGADTPASRSERRPT